MYGDLGTSPLYVMRAIVTGAGGVSRDVILGGLSCIIWTLTLQTTLKYVVFTLRANNKGEGGIFSLYTLVRRYSKWIFILAIIGSCTLLADSVITPAITVVSAIEGLKIINDSIPVIPIVLCIITALFFIQQYGTNLIGKSFGPIMFVWFLVLAVLGISKIVGNFTVLNAFNPYYAYKLLSHYPNGFLLLGAVFLCTTGADALFSDLGHCGLQNIRTSWIYVKISLILNYLGQGAWLLQNPNIADDVNPFYAIMPAWFVVPGIVIAAVAAVIASQAMITSSFTIINEAIILNFWPRVKVNHPTFIKGQMYIPSINVILWVSCMGVILYFKESAKMEAAYGLAITITMLMTTMLMGFYFYIKRKSFTLIVMFLAIYLIIEISFLIANLFKFMHGGWVTLLIAGVLFIIMFVWQRGRKIKNKLIKYEKIDRYFSVIQDIKADESIPKYATNVIYFTKSNAPKDIETKIMYSIVSKQPKRADVYWFIHVEVDDEPHTMTYHVTPYIQGTLFRIDFKLGFKAPFKINNYFRQVVENMVEQNEVDINSRYPSLKKYNLQGDFKFVHIERVQGYDFDFKVFDQYVMDIYDILKKIGISDDKAYGLDTSNVVVEKVPLVIKNVSEIRLTRID